MLATRAASPAWARMTMPEKKDEQLLAAVVRRDRAALEILYDRYASHAMGIAVQALRDRAGAEEVVQEAFWRVWKSATTFDSNRGSFAIWFFGMVRHLAIDELRRRAARPVNETTNSFEDVIAEIPDGAADVMETVWTKMQSERVREAMKQLPDAQRQVITLAYFQGMTRQEIAKQTGEPLGTIHTRARLALEKLRMILGPLAVE